MSFSECENLNHSIDMPLLIGRILLANLANLVAQFLFEFIIGRQQVVGQLLDDTLDIRGICDFVNEIQGLFFYLHVMIFQTIGDRLFMSLDGIVVDVNYFLELLESHVTHVVFAVHQEAAQDVDTEDSEALRGLDSHDGTGAFSKNWISWILACICVGCNMRQNIAHLICALLIFVTDVAEEF